jgi:hypothetical protein
MLYAELAQYQQSSVERTHSACLPAYFLDSDDSVICIWPNGTVERISVREGRKIVRPIEQYHLMTNHPARALSGGSPPAGQRTSQACPARSLSALLPAGTEPLEPAQD